MKTLTMVVLFVFIVSGLAFGANLKDTESATHGDSAASYQVVAEYPIEGGILTQFTLSVLSHYSYVLQSNGKALIVDPGRDVATYLEYCRERGLEIMGVFLTHSHADFVAGHTEIAAAARVPIFINGMSGAKYPHNALKDGDLIPVGNVTVNLLATPGHTPDGMCGLVKTATGAPVMLLSGDTLFIGSVGRPDLMGGQMAASTLASMMFDSWGQKLSKLPDNVAIFPAHGAGSLCGAHLSDDPTSTIGAQRTANPYLRHTSRADFIAAVLEGLPDAPQYFKYNAALNKEGPPLIGWNSPLKRRPFGRKEDSLSGAFLVDIRNADDYIPSHVRDSINIGLRGRFETWVGIMVPWGTEVTLIGDSKDLDEAVYRLHRVGYSASVVDWGEWTQKGLPVRQSRDVSPQALHEAMQQGTNPVIVDVRLPSEWMGLRIGNVVNIPLNRLASGSSVLDKTQPVVAVCNSAYRSSMALGVLEKEGFKDVASLRGGSEAWITAGYPTYGSQSGGAASPAVAVAQREVNLPDRISAKELMRMIVDIPGSFSIVDIRPAPAFADYSIQGAVNVHIADLIDNPAFLVGTGPLVIVDRDGSLSMAIGGILSQKTKRRIMVLYGGLESYWRESGFGVLGASPAPEVGGGTPRGTPAAPSVPGKGPAPAPAAPVKKSRAGC